MTYQSGRFAPLLTSVRDPWNRVLTALTWQSDDRLQSYTEGDYTGANSAGEKYTYSYGISSATKTDSFGSHGYTYDPISWLVANAGPTYDLASRRPLSASHHTGGTQYTYD